MLPSLYLSPPSGTSRFGAFQTPSFFEWLWTHRCIDAAHAVPNISSSVEVDILLPQSRAVCNDVADIGRRSVHSEYRIPVT